MPTDNVSDQAVVDGVRAGSSPRRASTPRCGLLLAAKRELGLDRQRYVDLQALRAIVGDSANQAAARKPAERAITLVRDSLALVPLARLPKTARVVSITLAPRTDLGAGATFNGELTRAFPALRALTLSPEAQYEAPTAGAGAAVAGGTYVASPVPALFPASVDNALRAAQGAEVAIVSSCFGASSSTARLAAPEGMAALIDSLQRRGTKVILATFSNPYIAGELPATSAYLVAWGSLPVSQRAAARALLDCRADHRPARSPFRRLPVTARGSAVTC